MRVLVANKKSGHYSFERVGDLMTIYSTSTIVTTLNLAIEGKLIKSVEELTPKIIKSGQSSDQPMKNSCIVSTNQWSFLSYYLKNLGN